MRNKLYAVVAACVAMLATSGIVALATAAPARGSESRGTVASAVSVDPGDALVSAFIDEQYRRALGGGAARHVVP